MECRKVQALLEARFIDGRDPLGSRTQGHVAACSACRTFYGRLYEVSAALGGAEPRFVSPEERELVAERVLDRVSVPPRPRWRLPVGLVSGFAAAAVIAAVALPLVGRRQQDPDLAARSPGHDDQLAASGVRVFCLVQGAVGLEARPVGSLPEAQAPRCTTRDQLGFSYFNETPAPLHLGVALRDSRGAWLVAEQAQGDISVAAPPTPAGDPEAPVPLVVPLAAVAPGRADVIGIFGPPLVRDELLEQARRALGDPRYPVHLVLEIAP